MDKVLNLSRNVQKQICSNNVQGLKKVVIVAHLRRLLSQINHKSSLTADRDVNTLTLRQTQKRTEEYLYHLSSVYIKQEKVQITI